MLPLRVTDKDAAGDLVYQGNTVNVGAGGMYFRTLNWQDVRLGMHVHVIMDIPPEMFQLLPFGGLRGFGEVIRMDVSPGTARGKSAQGGGTPMDCGIAVRMTSRLRFDPDLHLPRFEGDKKAKD